MTLTPKTLRATCADDLIAAAPLVLGFHPVDSVVMMTSGGARSFHARTDLPGEEDALEAPRLVAEMLVDAARRNRVRSVAVLFYSDRAAAVRPTWRALRGACRRARLDLVAALRVEDRRYYPLNGGQRLREVGVPYDVAHHPFVAQAVLEGVVVERDRSTLRARAAPDPRAQDEVRRAFESRGLATRRPSAFADDGRRWLPWLSRFVEVGVRGAAPASVGDVAEAVWLVQDVRFRDFAWALITREQAHLHQELWLDVLRRTPDHLAPAPAALLAWAAYQAGHGALAWIALDRCWAADPHYRLAALIARCLEGAVPPDTFDDGLGWDADQPA